MDARVMLVMAVAVLAGALPGWFLARRRGPWLALGWAGLWVLAMIAGMILGRQTGGWNALGYSAGVIMLVAPAALGAILGGALGLIRRR